MSPTLKKIRKQYIEFKEKIMPWYLKTFMFFPWFIMLSIILVLEPGAEPNSLPLLDQIQNPANGVGVKLLLSLITVPTTMFIFRNRWIVRSKNAQVYLKEIFSSFTTEGRKMLTEELQSTRPYLQVFSTITAVSAFVLSIFSLFFNTTSKVVTKFMWSDVYNFMSIVDIFLAIVFYSWLFMISGFFYDLAYKEIKIILREIEYGKEPD